MIEKIGEGDVYSAPVDAEAFEDTPAEGERLTELRFYSEAHCLVGIQCVWVDERKVQREGDIHGAKTADSTEQTYTLDDDEFIQSFSVLRGVWNDAISLETSRGKRLWGGRRGVTPNFNTPIPDGKMVVGFWGRRGGSTGNIIRAVAPKIAPIPPPSQSQSQSTTAAAVTLTEALRRIEELTSERQTLRRQIDETTKDLAETQAETRKLEQEKATLQQKNATLQQENATLQQENATLQKTPEKGTPRRTFDQIVQGMQEQLERTRARAGTGDAHRLGRVSVELRVVPDGETFRFPTLLNDDGRPIDTHIAGSLSVLTLEFEDTRPKAPEEPARRSVPDLARCTGVLATRLLTAAGFAMEAHSEVVGNDHRNLDGCVVRQVPPAGEAAVVGSKVLVFFGKLATETGW